MRTLYLMYILWQSLVLFMPPAIAICKRGKVKQENEWHLPFFLTSNLFSLTIRNINSRETRQTRALSRRTVHLLCSKLIRAMSWSLAWGHSWAPADTRPHKFVSTQKTECSYNDACAVSGQKNVIWTAEPHQACGCHNITSPSFKCIKLSSLGKI